MALIEARRRLQAADLAAPAGYPAASLVEQRAVRYIRAADPSIDPLRAAMSELLDRSAQATRTDSREYLFGTIISQLVPDEARILAALASVDRGFVAADVVHASRLRRRTRTLLANVSTVGRVAGVVAPDNVPTYLTRLYQFGLVEFGPPDDAQDVQYELLATDSTVQAAHEDVGSHRNVVRLARKTVRLSAFGREFWAASDPSRPMLPGPPQGACPPD
jgi:hypothetical protein